MDKKVIREALDKIEQALMMSRSSNENRGDYFDGWCTQALPYVDVLKSALLTEEDPYPSVVTVEARPVVQWFAKQMEQALRKNDHKGGWDKCDPYDLLERLREESDELHEAIGPSGRMFPGLAVIAEAADVANYAMMIADQYGNAIGQTRTASSPNPFSEQV